MGLWPFGREPADVEIVTRVVTAACRNQSKVRGKLTLHFELPQTQRAADEAGDAYAAITETILSEAAAPIEVLGNETQVVSTLAARAPKGQPSLRQLELASLHVLGMSAATSGRRSSGTMSAVQVSTDRIMTPAPSPAVTMGKPASIPPPTASPRPGQPPRRPSTTRMLAISSEVLIAPGSAPHAVGHAISPLVRDSATRLLIGLLRAHDLLVVRELTLDAGAGEVLGALVPVSDAPPGGYENSRAAEIGRWEGAFGVAVIAALRDEIAVIISYLAYSAMLAAGVAQATATDVLQSLAQEAFLHQRPPMPELGRYLHTVQPTLAGEVAARVAVIMGKDHPTQAMDAALTPVLTALEQDLTISAGIVKSATG